MLLSKGIPLLKNAQNISHTIRSAKNYKKAQILLLIVRSNVNKWTVIARDSAKPFTRKLKN